METESPQPIIETPVRRPLQLPQNVFFFNPRHREHINGLRTPLEIATIHTVFHESLVAGMITVTIAAVAFIVLPHLWCFILPLALIAALLQPSLIVAQANGRMNERLQRGGEFIVGEIISCSGGLGNRGQPPQFEVTAVYSFPTVGGITLIGTSTQVRPTLSGKQLPVQGTPVVVLYFSDEEHYLL